MTRTHRRTRRAHTLAPLLPAPPRRAFLPLLLLALLFLALPGNAGASAGAYPLAPYRSSPTASQDGGAWIDSCREINAPGYYELVADLKPHWGCLAIAANNVTLDCKNKSIKSLNGGGVGITVKRFGASPGIRPENIEIRNCKISNQEFGILVDEGRNIRILHNDLSRNFDDTHGTYSGPWMGAVNGGGLRMNRTQDSLVADNISNRSSNGIDLRDSERIIVRNNETTLNSGFGILLWNTSHSQVLGNTVNDNSRWCTINDGKFIGWVVQGCDTAGILLQDGSGNDEISDNHIFGQNGDGIFIRAHGGMRCGDHNLVSNNTIYGAIWNAVEVGFCNDVRIIGNRIERAKIGVWVSFMDNVQVRDNTFINIDTYGVAIKDSPNAVVTGNTFRDSPEGVYLFFDPSNALHLRKPLQSYASRGGSVIGNSFHNLRTAIHFKDSTGNRVQHNLWENVPTPYWLEGNSTNNQILP